MILLFLVSSGLVSAQAHRWNIVREEVRIPMRDGIRLGAILYRPQEQGKYPVIIYRTPYGAVDYDLSANFPRKAAKQGYAVLIVDVRGRFMSEGEFEAYRNEKKDGYDVIEWSAAQSWSNGKVGTYGGSYPGLVQWLAMSERPPHLVAAAPEMTPIGSHHFLYYGGAFSHPWLDWFIPYIFGDKRRRAGDDSGPWDDETATAQWEASNRRSLYGYRPLADLPDMKKYAPEYYAWLQHPDSSSWWDFANTADAFKHFTAPVFLESGWYDAAYGPKGATVAFNKMRSEAASESARNNTILVLGPWNHTSLNVRKTVFGEMENGPAAGIDYDEELLRWFNRELRGDDATPSLPRVSIFVMGENQWRTETEWPLSRSRYTSFYLRGTGSASVSNSVGKLDPAPPVKEKPDAYRFDPADPVWDKSYEKSYPYDHRAIESRSDVLVYTSEPLETDMEVTGEVIAELFVSSEGRDTDFSFTLCDVSPDGRSVNLHGQDAGYLRMRYRNGLHRQEMMVPGTVYPIRIKDVYTSNLFKKGHRIRVTVTSSMAPHYDPNPNTGTEIATERELRPVVNSVHHDKKFPSRILLPVVPR